MQFRRVGILISPRSLRLVNAIHACLPGQAARLYNMTQARGDAGPGDGMLGRLCWCRRG